LTALELGQESQGNARIRRKRVSRHAALSACVANLIRQRAQVGAILWIGAARFGAYRGGAARLD
jgi:hypothetical protein